MLQGNLNPRLASGIRYGVKLAHPLQECFHQLKIEIYTVNGRNSIYCRIPCSSSPLGVAGWILTDEK